jgi:hypothetical protein
LWYCTLNSGLALARQALYHLSHASSPFLCFLMKLDHFHTCKFFARLIPR